MVATAAAGIVAVIPPAVTALIFRRFLISGMMGGGKRIVNLLTNRTDVRIINTEHSFYFCEAIRI